RREAGELRRPRQGRPDPQRRIHLPVVGVRDRGAVAVQRRRPRRDQGRRAVLLPLGVAARRQVQAAFRRHDDRRAQRKGRDMKRRVESLMRSARPHAPRPRVLAAMVAASGAGVFLIIWQSKALRLDFSETNLAWPALVAFGVAWATLAEPLRAGVAMIAGAVASLGVDYGALGVLPVTHLGMATAAGPIFALIAGICYVVPQLFSFGPTALGC